MKRIAVVLTLISASAVFAAEIPVNGDFRELEANSPKKWSAVNMEKVTAASKNGKNTILLQLKEKKTWGGIYGQVYVTPETGEKVRITVVLSGKGTAQVGFCWKSDKNGFVANHHSKTFALNAKPETKTFETDGTPAPKNGVKLQPSILLSSPDSKAVVESIKVETVKK